ncbi:MAG: hypothetical protein ACT4OS_11850 [Acidimicrobiales bacterium]
MLVGTGLMVETSLLVETIDGDFQIAPGDEFTFGRSQACTFCVDDSDPNLSRRAGIITFRHPDWVLTNLSTTRSMVVFDDERRVRRELLSGQRHLLDSGRFTITLAGTRRSTFVFWIVVPPGPGQSNEVSGDDADGYSDSSPTLGPPNLSARQRLDVAALAWEWHRPVGRREPRPLTYEQAATKIGCTAKALERRVADLRASLVKRRYHQLDDLPMLCAFLVTATRVIGDADFALLEDRPG